MGVRRLGVNPEPGRGAPGQPVTGDITGLLLVCDAGRPSGCGGHTRWPSALIPLRPRQGWVASAVCGPGLSLPAGPMLWLALALESTAISHERTVEREAGQPLPPARHGRGSCPLGH